MPKLEGLSAALLRAGVDPAYVRRYLLELCEHYDDALRDELARGTSPREAAERAAARLGDPEDLARSVLAHPELRAPSPLHPALCFAAAPALCWLGLLGLTLCTVRFVMLGASVHFEPSRTFAFATAQVLGAGYLRVLPIVLATALFRASRRQAVPARWPLAGAMLLSVLAGTSTLELTFGPVEAILVGQASPLAPIAFPLLESVGEPKLALWFEALGRVLMLAASALLACGVLAQVERNFRPASGCDDAARGARGRA